MRRYTDEQLAAAVKSSRSWRGVLRVLGLVASSSSALRSVRIDADRLGLDCTHFTGQRRWTDAQLAAAVGSARTWAEVTEKLGLAGGSSTTTVRGHAVRLGLDTTHLGRSSALATSAIDMRATTDNLPRAGSLLAAARFELCGWSVSWPVEPSSYDLLVWTGRHAERVQVKTTTVRSGSTWTVWLRTGRQRAPYDPDEIDHFFVIDGEFGQYLIPVNVVGGLTAIQLSAYENYRLPEIKN